MYFQKLKDFKKKYPKVCLVPTPEERIKEVEKKYNMTFPASYREFLSITGDCCDLISVGHDFDYIEEINENALYFANEFKVRHLLPEHFWVITEVDGSETIFYFDLDDPSDDPPLYLFPMGYYHEKHEKEYLPKVFTDHFAAWINELVKDYEKEHPLDNNA